MSGRRILSLAVLLTGIAPPAGAIDLLESYRQARTNDQRFLAAQSAHMAGIEKLPQGRAQLLPSLSFNASRLRYHATTAYEGDTYLEGGARHFSGEERTLNITQPLYRKQNLAAWRQGEAQTESAEHQYWQARIELMLRASQAYFDLLIAQEELTLAGAQRRAMDGQFEQANARLAAGVAAITESHEARARAELARAQEVTARTSYETKARALAKLTGQDPGGAVPLRQNIPLRKPDPDDLSYWLMAAANNNPQLAALAGAARAAKEELERARAGHHPNIDLVASRSRNETTGSLSTSANSDTDSKMVGVQLQLPLYQGGYVNSRVREAAANLDRSHAELEDAKREIALQVQQAFVSVTNGILENEALEQAVLASEQSLEANQMSLKVGTRNLVDVLNAAQQVYTARRDLSHARHNYLLGLLKLEAVAGALGEDDLERINALLEAPAAAATP